MKRIVLMATLALAAPAAAQDATPEGQLVEGLLEHGAEVDHRVDVLARAGVPDHRRLRILFQPVGQPVDGRARVGAVGLAGEGVQAPARVGLGHVPELHLLGVRQAHHGR